MDGVSWPADRPAPFGMESSRHGRPSVDPGSHGAIACFEQDDADEEHLNPMAYVAFIESTSSSRTLTQPNDGSKRLRTLVNGIGGARMDFSHRWFGRDGCIC